MLKMAVVLTHPAPARQDAPFPEQGRNERRGGAYCVRYVEPLSEARTMPAVFSTSWQGGGSYNPTPRSRGQIPRNPSQRGGLFQLTCMVE